MRITSNFSRQNYGKISLFPQRGLNFLSKQCKTYWTTDQIRFPSEYICPLEKAFIGFLEDGIEKKIHLWSYLYLCYCSWNRYETLTRKKEKLRWLKLTSWKPKMALGCLASLHCHTDKAPKVSFLLGFLKSILCASIQSPHSELLCFPFLVGIGSLYAGANYFCLRGNIETVLDLNEDVQDIICELCLLHCGMVLIFLCPASGNKNPASDFTYYLLLAPLFVKTGLFLEKQSSEISKKSVFLFIFSFHLYEEPKKQM